MDDVGSKGWIQARLELADDYLTSRDWEIIFKAGDLLADPDGLVRAASQKHDIYKTKQAEVFRKIRERRKLLDAKHTLKVIVKGGMVEDIENLPNWMDYIVEDHDMEGYR